LTSRGRRFRHHHAAAHTDRGENHDPTGTLITAQALNGGLDRPTRNKRTVPLKMVTARAGLSEFPIGDRVETDAFWVAFDPDKQSGPRCIEVLFFVAPGNGTV
jgi:hypothetical protein